MSGLIGPPFFVVLMIRHTSGCGRPLARLITDGDGLGTAERIAAGSEWSQYGMPNPCACGVDPPDPASLLPEIRRALAKGRLPEDHNDGRPVRASVEVRY